VVGVIWCLDVDVTTVWLCVSGSVSPAFVKPSAMSVVWVGHQVLSCCCEGVGGGSSCVRLLVADAGVGGGCTPPLSPSSPVLSLSPPCACASAFASGSEGAILTISVLNLVIVAVNLGCTQPANPGSAASERVVW